MIRQSISHFGRLDILHNSAAATQLAATKDLTVADMDPAVWDETLRTNLTSTMLATKFAVPQLIATGEASIVHTSSGAGIAGDIGALSIFLSSSRAGFITGQIFSVGLNTHQPYLSDVRAFLEG